MEESYIQVRDLMKIFELKTGEKIKALNKVDLDIKKHEIFGIVGPNGAGKTTLIKILCTLLQPTSGTVLIDGMDTRGNLYAIRTKLGVMFDIGVAYGELSGYKNLKYWAKLYRIDNYKQKISSILEELDLTKWANERVSSYSLGMMLKHAIGRLILTNPAIWILDEPTRGMDVYTLQQTVQILKKRKSENTIIVTSHDLNIMDKLCDRIAIIDRGNILAVDSPENLKVLKDENVAIDIGIEFNADALVAELKMENGVFNTSKTLQGINVIIKDKRFYPRLFSILEKYPVSSINERKYTLEDIFLKLTKK